MTMADHDNDHDDDEEDHDDDNDDTHTEDNTGKQASSLMTTIILVKNRMYMHRK